MFVTHRQLLDGRFPLPSRVSSLRGSSNSSGCMLLAGSVGRAVATDIARGKMAQWWPEPPGIPGAHSALQGHTPLSPCHTSRPVTTTESLILLLFARNAISFSNVLPYFPKILSPQSEFSVLKVSMLERHSVWLLRITPEFQIPRLYNNEQ